MLTIICDYFSNENDMVIILLKRNCFFLSDLSSLRDFFLILFFNVSIRNFILGRAIILHDKMQKTCFFASGLVLISEPQHNILTV